MTTTTFTTELPAAEQPQQQPPPAPPPAPPSPPLSGWVPAWAAVRGIPGDLEITLAGAIRYDALPEDAYHELAGAPMRAAVAAVLDGENAAALRRLLTQLAFAVKQRDEAKASADGHADKLKARLLAGGNSVDALERQRTADQMSVERIGERVEVLEGLIARQRELCRKELADAVTRAAAATVADLRKRSAEALARLGELARPLLAQHLQLTSAADRLDDQGGRRYTGTAPLERLLLGNARRWWGADAAPELYEDGAAGQRQQRQEKGAQS